MKLLATIMALFVSAHAFGTSSDNDLIHVNSYDADVKHVEKFISSEKTQCDVSSCITADVSIISDNSKGIEPGKNRAMFVTMVKYDLNKRTALFLTIAQFDFVDNIPKLRAVLGSPEHPAADRYVMIASDNPLSKEIDLLIKLKAEFSGIKADSTI